MPKSKEQEEIIKKQTMRDIKRAGRANQKQDKEAKKTKKKHLEPTKIVAIIIVSILVAIMLFGACATLIFYMQYYA